MSFKDNRDLRNTGSGGWFYAEHELLDVFVPLIGADGAMVYMTMCRLIPLAGVDPDRQVTLRAVSEASTVSKSTVGRMIAAIVALGMVEETRSSRNRPSTYKLVSLRQLAAVGRQELERRLGVLRGDTKTSAPSPYGEDGAAYDRLHGVGAPLPRLVGVAEAGAHPARNGVPPGDIVGVEGKLRLVEEPVSQKRASVSQKRASVSQKRASVSQKRASVSQKRGLLKEEKEREKDYYPPTPLRGEGDAGSRSPLEQAVRKVIRECSLSEPRLERVVLRALRMEAARSDAVPDWNEIAERMIAAHKRYAGLGERGLLRVTVRVRRFFAEGMWRQEGLWMIDTERTRQMAEASIGTWRGAS